MRQWLGVIGIAAFSSALTYALISSNPFFTLISVLGLVISAFYVFPQNQNNQKSPELTERQYKILSLVKNGYSKREIARALNISTRTLYRELRVLIERGLLPPETVSYERSSSVSSR